MAEEVSNLRRHRKQCKIIAEKQHQHRGSSRCVVAC